MEDFYAYSLQLLDDYVKKIYRSQISYSFWYSVDILPLLGEPGIHISILDERFD